MVTPVDESQEEEQDEVSVPEVVDEVPATTKWNKADIKFDFAVENTDRSGLVIYTVSTKPAEELPQTLTILAPNYGAALEIAGISKDVTVKVSEVPFEG